VPRPTVIVHPGLTDLTTGPLEYAQRVSERGLHGIYLPEHTHIPVDFRPGDYPTGEPMPDRYRRLLDPFVALSFIAAHYPLEVGTCVCLLAQHDPIALAKQVATLDLLSQGRVVLGVGFGWNTAEFASHHAIDAATRPDLVAESAQLVRTLWQEEIAEFAGEHRSLPPSWAWPKPVQHPGPPILLGARGTARNFRRIAEWADGWISPTDSLGTDDYVTQLNQLRAAWERRGRDPATLKLMALDAPTAATVADQYARAVDLELDRLILHVEDHPADIVLPILDRIGDVLSAPTVEPGITSSAHHGVPSAAVRSTSSRCSPQGAVR
jgi:probable F420-dependent oxidoreductase